MESSEKITVAFDWQRLRKRKADTANEATDETEQNIPDKVCRTTSYVKKLQQTDPDKYKKYKEKERDRKRKSYVPISQLVDDDEVAARRTKWADQKTKQRMSKPRTSNDDGESIPRKKISEMSTIEKREYNRLKKQESRKREKPQKKAAEKVKDRVRKKTESDSAAKSQKPGKGKSLSSFYRSKNRIKRVLPTSPSAWAKVVKAVIEDGTPRKQLELKRQKVTRNLEDDLGEHVIASLGDSIGLLNKKNENHRTQLYSIAQASVKNVPRGLKKVFLKRLGLGDKVKRKLNKVHSIKRKQRKDAVSSELRQKVMEFWMSEGISRCVPLKKRVKKGKFAYILEVSYFVAHRRFLKVNPGTKISYGTFIRLKPSNVRHMRAYERLVCCCQSCENIRHILVAINKAAVANDLAHLKIACIESLSDKSLCQYTKPGFPKLRCIERKCGQCGLHLIQNHFRPLTEEAGDTVVKFDRWVRTTEEKVTGNGKKMVTRTVIKTDSAKLYDIMELAITDLSLFSAHLMRAKWQQQQLALAKMNMLPRSAVWIIDFAENYSCSLQDEVQSHHWTQNQVTVHPVMVYINNSDVTGGYTNTESVIVISDDLTHDAHAVSTFLERTANYLSSKYILKSVVQFSDCCASQYRGYMSFADLSFKDNVCVNFFEACHGKSAADGLAALVKHHAERAVTRRQVCIRDARELYEFCDKNLSSVSRDSAGRKFLFIESAEINRNRPSRNVVTLKGTRQVHSAKSTGTKYKIATRSLSCFCTFCILGQGDKCSNSGTVDEWIFVTMKLKNSGSDYNDDHSTVSVEEPVDPVEAVAGSSSTVSTQVTEADADNTSVGAPMYAEGDPVAVMIVGKRKRAAVAIFMAEIVSFFESNSTATVKYMKKCGDNLYQWPATSALEHSTEPVSSIIPLPCKPKFVKTPQIHELPKSIIESVDQVMNIKNMKYKMM